MKTNREHLVMHSVQGKVSHPKFLGYRVNTEGTPFVIPGTGAISYNVKVGDPAFGLVGDHIEPGVTIKNENVDENAALNVFACIGNDARVITGDAKGATGYVTGSHGGVEHVMVAFDQETLDKLTCDDKILIKGHGQGLAIEGMEDVKLMSLDPRVFEAMNIEIKDDVLQVPVAAVIPQYLMGSGVGSVYAQKGDYDLITSDRAEISRLGLDKLRFGDFVLLQDCDNTYGMGGRIPGAVSIGVVIHSDCIKTGHGPGISIVMSCKTPKIAGKIDAKANLIHFVNQR